MGVVGQEKALTHAHHEGLTWLFKEILFHSASLTRLLISVQTPWCHDLFCWLTAAVGAVGMKCGQVSQSLTNLSSGPAQPSAPTLLKMNLASGDMNVKVPMSQPEKVLETSSEGSQTEGG